MMRPESPPDRGEGNIRTSFPDIYDDGNGDRIFRLFAQNAQDIIFLLQTLPERRFMYVSPSSTRLSGYTPEEFYADPDLYLKIVHPDDRAAVDHRSDAHAPVEKLMLRWVRKDGSILWTEQRLTSVFNEKGDRISVEGIVRDVSERAEAQAQIDLQVGALNAAANGILIADTGGMIVWANQAMTELTGYNPDELVGQSTRIFKSGEQDVAYYEDLWATIASGNVWRGELLNRRKDGTTYVDEMTITPVRDRYGIVRNYVAVKQDVTIRKNYEAEIVRAREKAESLTRLKTSIVNNMSHEIRTPLTGIIGFADILKDMLTGEKREFAEYIAFSGERLMETLNSVLDLAELESGNINIGIVPVDVVLHARQTLNVLRPVAESRGLRVGLDVSGDGPFLALGDVAAYNRILMNVLSNAIKFTRQGRVNVRIDSGNDEVRVAVQDTGIGIDPAFLPFIFDEYAQESAGTNRDFEGSGLGLSISKRLAELIGATLTVDSECGVGSTFTLSMPISTTLTGDTVPRGHVLAVPSNGAKYVPL